jgi:hypothetical protein
MLNYFFWMIIIRSLKFLFDHPCLDKELRETLHKLFQDAFSDKGDSDELDSSFALQQKDNTLMTQALEPAESQGM